MEEKRSLAYLYLNAVDVETYLSFIDEPSFFLILKSAGLSKESGDALIETLRTAITKAKILTVDALDALIGEALRTHNIPVMTSLAAGVLQNQKLLLKTIGEGHIYIQRKGKLVKLLQGNNVAAGPILLEDRFIFTTSSFLDLFDSYEHFVQFLSTHTLESIVDALHDEFSEKKEHGNVALFMQLSREPEQVVVSSSTPHSKFSLGTFIQDLRARGGNKKWTMVLVAALIAILGWSVVFGYQRRLESQRTKDIGETTQSVSTILGSAKSIASTDLNEAKSKISQADILVDELANKVGSTRKKEVDALRKSVRQTEDEILQRDTKTATEFYDLALENKNATGTKIVLSDDNLFILNPRESSIYRLSIPQKSITSIKNTHFSNGEIFDVYDNIVYVVDNGTYTVDEEGVAKKVIENDTDWRSLKDIKLYGGNIYLLDTRSNDVYKYSVVEKGFADKVSYLSGYQLSLSQTHSLAIDGSIYIDTPEKIYKFTSGSAQDFGTDYMQSPFEITKLLAVTGTENVYIWSKTKGVIYMTDTKGAYKKSIMATALKQADDVVVFKNKIYSLQKNKIFVLEIN